MSEDDIFSLQGIYNVCFAAVDLRAAEMHLASIGVASEAPDAH